jgi:hypothetical protein
MQTDTKYLVALAKQVRQPVIQLPILLGRPPKIQDNNQSMALGAINEANEFNLRGKAKPNGKSRKRRTDRQD